MFPQTARNPPQATRSFPPRGSRLQDQAYLAEVRTKVAKAREALAQTALANGLVPLPSATNFLTIDCGADGAFAKRVLAGLVARGIFVRMPFVAPHDRCIRVSVGTAADLEAFEAALPLALAEAKTTQA